MSTILTGNVETFWYSNSIAYGNSIQRDQSINKIKIQNNFPRFHDFVFFEYTNRSHFPEVNWKAKYWLAPFVRHSTLCWFNKINNKQSIRFQGKESAKPDIDVFLTGFIKVLPLKFKLTSFPPTNEFTENRPGTRDISGDFKLRSRYH